MDSSAGHNIPDVISNDSQRVRITFHNLMAMLLPTQLSMQTALFVARAHCNLQPLLNQKHKAFSGKLISSKSEPIWSYYVSSFHPKHRILHLPCFMWFLSAHLSILSRSHSKAAQPFNALTTPRKLLSSMDLLRMQQIRLLTVKQRNLKHLII